MIPFAGYRFHDGNVYDMGGSAFLWSSSPVDGLAHGLGVDPNDVDAYKYDIRANAHSVRCFKDSSENSLFEREDITICNKKDDKDCVTMMDRNL